MATCSRLPGLMAIVFALAVRAMATCFVACLPCLFVLAVCAACPGHGWLLACVVSCVRLGVACWGCCLRSESLWGRFRGVAGVSGWVGGLGAF